MNRRTGPLGYRDFDPGLLASTWAFAQSGAAAGRTHQTGVLRRAGEHQDRQAVQAGETSRVIAG
jgi:hypothetical protein